MYTNKNNQQNQFNPNGWITITIVPNGKTTKQETNINFSQSPQIQTFFSIQNSNELQDKQDKSIFSTSQTQEKVDQNENVTDILLENKPENVNNSIFTTQKLEQQLVNDPIYSLQNVLESANYVGSIEISNDQKPYYNGRQESQNSHEEYSQILNFSAINSQQGDLLPIFQTHPEIFQNDQNSYLNSYKPIKNRLVVFGDNYQDSTDPEIPNLVARINFNGSEFNNQPHPIWIDFLRNENYEDLQIEIIDNGIPFSTARRIPQVLDGNCEAIIDLLEVSQQQCELFFQGVSKQVETYLQDVSDVNLDMSESQFFILSGSIDVINSRPEKAYNETLPTQIVEETASAVNILLENGANNVKVANIPPLYLTPLILSRQASRQEDSRILVQNTNQQFKNVFCDSRYFEKVELIDFESLFLEVMIEAEEAEYEIDTPLTLSPKEPITYGDGPYFWIDSIHPGVFGHKLMAQKLRGVLFDLDGGRGYNVCT